MLTLLLALALQDPDLSTPERAVEAYLKARDKFSGAASLVVEVEKVIAEVEGPAATDDLKKRREKRLAERTALENLKRQRYVAHLVEESKAEGARVVLTVQERFIVRQIDRAAGQVVDREDARFKRFVYEQSGARWLIQRELDRCPPCAGRGVCPWCNGEGTVAEKPCPRCKGTKKCDACLGAQWKERSFDRGLTALGALDGFKPRTDRSGPRAAAEAFADALVDEQVRIGAIMRKLFDDVIALLRAYFVPDVSRSAEQALKKAVEQGRTALKEHVPAVLDLKEEEETRATAVVSTPPSPWGPAAKQRVVLLRFGSAWLVDDVQTPCATCGAKGACSGCLGAQGESVRCIRCGGSRKCRDCAGVGYRGDGK